MLEKLRVDLFVGLVFLENTKFSDEQVKKEKEMNHCIYTALSGGTASHELWEFCGTTMHAVTQPQVVQMFSFGLACYALYSAFHPVVRANLNTWNQFDNFLTFRDLRMLGQIGKYTDAKLAPYWGVANFYFLQGSIMATLVYFLHANFWVYLFSLSVIYITHLIIFLYQNKIDYIIRYTSNEILINYRNISMISYCSPYICNGVFSIIFAGVFIKPVTPVKPEITITIEVPLWTQNRFDSICVGHSNNKDHSFGIVAEDFKLPPATHSTNLNNSNGFGTPPEGRGLTISGFGTPLMDDNTGVTKLNVEVSDSPVVVTNLHRQRGALSELQQALGLATQNGRDSAYISRLNNAITDCKLLEGVASQLDESKKDLKEYMATEGSFYTDARKSSFKDEVNSWTARNIASEQNFRSALNTLLAVIKYAVRSWSSL